jgi:hypothetical protein
MELVAAQPTEQGTVRVTLAFAGGLRSLEGTTNEITALCEAMNQMCVLAGAAPDDQAWVTEIHVGPDTVRLGVGGGGRVRFKIDDD